MKEFDAVLARLALSMGPSGVELGGDNVRIEQEPENGLELRMTILDDHGQPLSIASAFSPGPEPPAALPPDVPFLPDTAIHVIEDRDRRVMLASWRIDDESADALATAVDRVVALSREAGWSMEQNSPGETARLEKAGRRRRVQANRAGAGAAVSLADGPA